MDTTELERLATLISSQCLHHPKFDQAVRDIQTQLLVLQPGEMLSVVGPSRVGKTRAVRKAFEGAVRSPRQNGARRPVVWIVNENSQAEGDYSTKAFMREACKAVDHPIYGHQHSMSPDGLLRLERHIARIPESIFREAFERGLVELGTSYLVVDETHHVLYVKGGAATAGKILDSWKCLAHKTGTILVLIGSYALVDAIEKVPHLIGRQRRPMEFSRYKPDSADDLMAFKAVLATYSDILPFPNARTSLRTWSRQLFDGSLGCVGHLSLWIRSALAWCCSHNNKHLTWEAFEAAAFVQAQFEDLHAEIVEGEKKMAPVRFKPAGSNDEVGPAEANPVLSNERIKTKPFARKTRRRARGERA